MKPTFIALLVLCLCLSGCGKKAASEPEQAKGSSKPALPDSKNSQPKPPPKKKTPQPKPEPKFDPTKHERFLWEFEMRDDVASSPAIGSDGTVYVGSADNKLYAINRKRGVKLWEFETGGSVWSSPAIGSDGTVYVGSFDKKLYAFKTDSKGLAKSPWPMFGQNARHTGRALKK